MKIDRLLSIVILLLNRDRVPAKDLAEIFEVSVRTIYRDVESINLAGIPVISYPGPNGGFGIDNRFSLDRQVLSLTDITTVLGALKGISGALDDRGLDSAIDKITTLVPRGSEGAAREFESRFAIDILPWGYQERQREVMRSVYRAVSENKLLTFGYKNNRGEYLRRTVEPMTLVFKGYAWYLFAFCRLKKDYRVFRLSRFRDMIVEHKGFIRKEAIWRDYFEPETRTVEKVELVIRFDRTVAYRIEDYFGEEALERADDGSIQARVAFPFDDWVYSFILSFGEHAEVLEPEWIREKLSEIAESVARKYRNNP